MYLLLNIDGDGFDSWDVFWCFVVVVGLICVIVGDDIDVIVVVVVVFENIKVLL